LISIFPNRKASQTLDVEENQLAMVAMLLEFTFAISPSLSFALGLCISPEVVNKIGSEELALAKGAFDSLRARL
jgi:hypothetical protein